MSTLVEELEHTVTHIAATVGPSVVQIGRGRGSGVVLAAGLVLTNAHNLEGDEVAVGFADGRAATATVKGVDGSGDLAVLTVDTGDAPAIAWTDGAGPQVGTPVFALANSRITFGLVSAVSQAFRGPGGSRIGGGFEHTAPLSRGSSGGPVVDATGALVGINTHRVGGGFYLAMPADAELHARADALSAGQTPTRVRLGVALAPVHAAHRLRAAVGLPERDGLLVRGVEADGPADRAGIKQGDLLVEAGGRALVTHDDLYAVLDAASVGSSLAVSILRGAEELSVTVAFTQD